MSNILSVAWFETRILAFARLKMSDIRLVIICFLTIFIIAFPPIEKLFDNAVGIHDTWSVVLKQANNPFTKHWEGYSEGHNAKRAYRLLVPMIVRCLGLQSPGEIYVLQLSMIPFFFYMLLGLSKSITNHTVIAYLTVFGFCFIYAGQVGVLDVHAKFDSFALTALLASIYFESFIFVFLFSFFAAFADERGLIALSYVFLWWRLVEIDGYKNLTWQAFFKLEKYSLAVVLAGSSYLIIRAYISSRYGLETPTDGLGLTVLLVHANMYLFGLWSGFEGYWIVICAALYMVAVSKGRWVFTIILLLCLPSIVVSFLVYDMTRSLIYAVPLFFVSLRVLTECSSRFAVDVKKVIFLSVFVNMLVPTYFTESSFAIEGANPIFIKAFKWLV